MIRRPYLHQHLLLSADKYNLGHFSTKTYICPYKARIQARWKCDLYTSTFSWQMYWNDRWICDVEKEKRKKRNFDTFIGGFQTVGRLMYWGDNGFWKKMWSLFEKLSFYTIFIRFMYELEIFFCLRIFLT